MRAGASSIYEFFKAFIYLTLSCVCIHFSHFVQEIIKRKPPSEPVAGAEGDSGAGISTNNAKKGGNLHTQIPKPHRRPRTRGRLYKRLDNGTLVEVDAEGHTNESTAVKNNNNGSQKEKNTRRTTKNSRNNNEDRDTPVRGDQQSGGTSKKNKQFSKRHGGHSKPKGKSAGGRRPRKQQVAALDPSSS